MQRQTNYFLEKADICYIIVKKQSNADTEALSGADERIE